MDSELWTRLGREIDAFREDVRGDLPLTPQTSPEEVRAELEEHFDFERPRPLGEITEEAQELLRKWTVHVTSPRCFGLFNPGVREAGIIADALAALYNPQLAVWSHAPAAAEIERHVLRRFAEKLGYESEQSAFSFTSGGAEANLQATLTALMHRFPKADEGGVRALGAQPVIYLTGESHHSFVKIARMTGLGTDALREVGLTEALVMDPEALRARIREDRRAAGRLPFMVVATAGTTGAGLIDPLLELADVAEEEGLWLHADAAWGGSAVLSDRLRPALAGIERADSVTWDAHKWLQVPMGAGMFFCKRPEAVRRAFAITTSYMPGETGGAPDPYATTAQWSRRAIGLKVFMGLAELGLEGYGEMVTEMAALGDVMRERLRSSGWAVANETPLPVVCFTCPEMRNGRFSARDLLEVIYERGRVWISDVALDGEEVLRACVANHRSGREDVDVLLKELEAARHVAQSSPEDLAV